MSRLRAMMRCLMSMVSVGSGSRIALVLIAFGLAGCSRGAESKPASQPAEAAAPAHPGGIDLAGMDRSVAPGDDFFAYANGTWAKTAEIPPDRSSYGVWAAMADRAQQRTRELLEGLAKPASNQTPDERKVAEYFTSYMDEATIESKGLMP